MYLYNYIHIIIYLYFDCFLSLSSSGYFRYSSDIPTDSFTWYLMGISIYVSDLYMYIVIIIVIYVTCTISLNVHYFNQIFYINLKNKCLFHSPFYKVYMVRIYCHTNIYKTFTIHVHVKF